MTKNPKQLFSYEPPEVTENILELVGSCIVSHLNSFTYKT